MHIHTEQSLGGELPKCRQRFPSTPRISAHIFLLCDFSVFSASLATRRCRFCTWKTRTNRSCCGQASGALPHPVPRQRVLIFQEKGTRRAALSSMTEGPGPLGPWVSALSVQFTGISSSGPSPRASTEGCPGWVYDQETLLTLP